MCIEWRKADDQTFFKWKGSGEVKPSARYSHKKSQPGNTD